MDSDPLRTHESPNRSIKIDLQTHHSTCCLSLTDRFKQGKISGKSAMGTRGEEWTVTAKKMRGLSVEVFK